MLVEEVGTDTTQHLSHHVSQEVVTIDRTFDKHHSGDCGVVVSTGDSSTEEDDGRQGQTNREGLTGGEDYGKKDEGAKKFNEIFRKHVF